VGTDLIFLVMELVVGGSLEERLTLREDESFCLRVLADVARGLEALHAAGIVHRDLKPANVLLCTDSSGAAIAKVADFGIARHDDMTPDPSKPAEAPFAKTLDAARAKLTTTGALLGTPLYMAPEVALGAPATPTSDVYGFGLMAFELLTGHPPYATPPALAALMGQTIEPPPELVRDKIPDAVRELVRRAFSLRPEDRPTAVELAEGLARHA